MRIKELIGGLALLIAASNASAKMSVFACEPEWEALVKSLGGDHVTTFSATHAFQDPHYIEALPALISKLNRADLLVCTGAELEVGWLPLLQRKSGNPDVQPGQAGVFLAADFVKKLEVPHVHDCSGGDIHAAGNPHVHLDPRRVLTIAQHLHERLIQLDPSNSDDYRAQFEHFSARWQNHIARWERKSQPLTKLQVMVQHRNWSYLFDWLGIREVADLEPKPGLPPTSRHLQSLVKTAGQQMIDGILIANYQEDRGAKWLSEKIDRPYVALPFTLGAEEDIETLAQLFDRILDHLLDISPQ
ncbi:MAG TPA: zinc ABC transporter substrate-binding protein [Gammaproteobacteria bacterium]|jgi:zinc/manganese transport system substrate-binding protein|nr:zinc ABC transporter substrate-binding protein [Gammaproteobacteria bacterium]